eukprot:TRINITY_DN108714_c0_g1_i1.p1 TRINITY_DN108714_c0_g1~~TRINITY_DN108714_c0_g1_i1.p1  ORF type:complete len:714 (-),score=104.88 TRINITY_DN108714_c0_g1_i1:76-2217(-)
MSEKYREQSHRYRELLNQLGTEFDRQLAETASLQLEISCLRKESHRGQGPILLPGCVPSGLPAGPAPELNTGFRPASPTSTGSHPPEYAPEKQKASVHAHFQESNGSSERRKTKIDQLNNSGDSKLFNPSSKELKKAYTQRLPGAGQSIMATEIEKGTTAEQTHSSVLKQKRWYIINPEQSPFMTRWDIVTMGALAFVALVTPIQVGIMDLEEMDGLFVVSLCVDVIFLVDICLQFFTMYPMKKARGIEMEHRLHKIVVHYLTTWFPLDFITILPFDLISLSLRIDALSQMNSLKILRLLRLLKLMRILKTSRVFHRLEIGLSVPYQRFALVKFLGILLLVCHWQTCIWAMTLDLVTAEGVPKWIDSFDELEKYVDYKTRDSGFRLYTASFYFNSYTMTSVGYGDIGPKNLLERLVCIMIILVAGLCWAYILGEVCGIVGDMNAEAQHFRKKMDNLNYMMAERSLPQSMRQRLRSFFLSNKDSVHHVTQKRLLGDMSPALQGEVAMALNSVWIGKVSFLNKLLDAAEQNQSYRACIADVARSLDTQAFAQGESFGQIQVLYILYKGLVGHKARVLKMGSVWGEDFVLSDLSLIHMFRATALTYVEVIFMDRETFMDVVDLHKESCPQLEVQVRGFCVRMAARRGIIQEAKRRARLLQKSKQKISGLQKTRKIDLFDDGNLSGSLQSAGKAEDVPTLMIESHPPTVVAQARHIV